LDEYGVAPRQSRSLADCERALSDAPASIVAIELTMANVGDVLDLLTRIPRDYPHARVIVVARRLLRRYEWLMREAGAVQFVTTPRDLRNVARLVARHLARSPRQPASTTERIWAELPWSD
jgi:DNA-binding NtrC family response regulator